MPGPGTIIDGTPGTKFVNKTERVLYQFHCSFVNTCGLCLSMDSKIGPPWGIPIHWNCRCRQTVVAPGGTASEPFIDYRAVLDKMAPDQQQAAIGTSAYKLLKAGVVEWKEIVTPSRVRTLREIVSRRKLSVDAMTKAGVSPRIAAQAHATVNTAEHLAVEAQRKALIDKLSKAGIAPKALSEELARRIARRVTIGAGAGIQAQSLSGVGGHGAELAAMLAAAAVVLKPKVDVAAKAAKAKAVAEAKEKAKAEWVAAQDAKIKIKLAEAAEAQAKLKAEADAAAAEAAAKLKAEADAKAAAEAKEKAEAAAKLKAAQIAAKVKAAQAAKVKPPAPAPAPAPAPVPLPPKPMPPPKPKPVVGPPLTPTAPNAWTPRPAADFKPLEKASIAAWGEQHYGDLKNFDKPIKDALLYYTGSGANYMNKQLREGQAVIFRTYGDYHVKKIEEYIGQLDKLVAAKPVPQDMMVYRGQKFGTQFNMPELADLKPGDVLPNKGYTSTSTNVSSRFDGTRMDIRVPKGTLGAYTNAAGEQFNMHPDEKELLLARDTTFRIVSIDRGKNSMIVEVVNQVPHK